MFSIKNLSNQYLVFAISLFIIIGIGYIDYISSFEMSFSIFYLVPISFYALYRDTQKILIIILTFFSAALWGVSEFFTNDMYSHLFFPIWNTLVRFVIFLAIGILLFIMKNKHKNLIKSNSELTRLNNEIENVNKQLSIEKHRYEGLLTNILPVKIIERLNDYHGLIANNFEQCTVMFTDFKDFSILAEEYSTEELVTELNFCFSKFDDVILKYGIEKIKTIGDSYMCVGGIPMPKAKHYIDVILAAIEISEFMEQYKKKRIEVGKNFFEIRIGIHTGPLIAGVVGKHKFSYDVWGDTVNYASRLENASMPGLINISETTHLLVMEYFDCIYRGKIAVKNKCEANMYFVQRIKREFSNDENGRIPNEKLISLKYTQPL